MYHNSLLCYIIMSVNYETNGLPHERSEPLSRVFNDQSRDIYIYIYIYMINKNIYYK